MNRFDPPADYLARYLDRLDEIPLPAYREGELDDKPVFQRRFHEVGAYNVPGVFRYERSKRARSPAGACCLLGDGRAD